MVTVEIKGNLFNKKLMVALQTHRKSHNTKSIKRYKKPPKKEEPSKKNNLSFIKSQ